MINDLLACCGADESATQVVDVKQPLLQDA